MRLPHLGRSAPASVCRPFGVAWHLALLLLLLSSPPLPAQAQPVNDLFANRTVLTGTNITISADNWGATQEPNEPLWGYFAQGSSVWWSWTAPIDCSCTLSTAGSSFDTVLGLCTGAAVESLYVEEYSDDYQGTTSRVKFDAFAGQTYHIFVDGYQGEQGAITLRLTVGPSLIGSLAPGWTLQTPGGVTIRSTDFAGKVVILDFWATWCGPCKAEIPDFVQLQDQYRDDGLVIVGASTDSTSAVVRDFLLTFSPTINYTTVMANAQVQANYGGIEAIPTTFIIDRSNRIQAKFVGTRSKETFVSAIAPFLYGRLDWTVGAEQRRLSWRADGAPQLLHSPNLVSPQWSVWPTPADQLYGTNSVELPGSGLGFFRLQYPR